MAYPLDPAPQDMRAMGEAVLAYLIEFTQGLDDAPADATEGGIELAARLRESPPEVGGRWDELFEQAQQAIAHTYEYAGPGYLAYIPGGGLFTAAVAEFLAQGVNRFVNLWQPSPAVVQIEQNVIRWLADLFDYGPQARGLLTTGGSMANLSAIVTARHAKLGEDFLDGTYYVSEQVHTSVSKACTIAGFAKRNLRLVPTDDQLRMDPDALRSMVKADRAVGFRPFLVVPSAGTTNTGAVDPLDAVADVAEAEGLWMHVDGAYGGFFQLTERGHDRFKGIERADSVTQIGRASCRERV
jgi:Glutamate decarboxylase and related PLP-dependent proteins